MTYTKLIQHGLRMLMPFADRIATRGLMALSVALVLALGAAGTLIAVKLLGSSWAPGWIIYALCTGALLCALGAACLVIVFALFVQSQGLSLAFLDQGIRSSDIALPSTARRIPDVEDSISGKRATPI